LRSLLWFPLVARTVLLAASVIVYGVAALIALAIFRTIRLDRHHVGVHPHELLGRLWQARALARVARFLAAMVFACPSCKTAPPLANSGVAENAARPSTHFLRREFARIAERQFTPPMFWTAELQARLENGRLSVESRSC